jgi:DNA-binding NarL/FixJ family response regulator
VDQRTEPCSAITRVVVAHATVAGRLALRMLVENEPELEFVAEAATAVDAGRIAREQHADFLVLSDGLLATGRTGVLPASCTVVLLGMEDEPAAATAALIPGPRRYVLWDRAAEELPPVLLAQATPTVSST